MPDATARRTTIKRDLNAALKAKVRKVTFNLDKAPEDITPPASAKRVKKVAAKVEPTPAPTPEVVRPTFLYMDFHKQSHLFLGVQGDFNCYLTLYTGEIKVTRLRTDSPNVAELKPYKGEDAYPIKRAAAVYLKSMLPKSDEARWVLEQIISADADRVDFINGCPCSNATPTVTKRRVKADKGASKGSSKVEGDAVTASDIAAELGIDPKALRGVLRGANVTKPGASWTWPAAQRADLVAQFKALVEAAKK